LKINFIIPGTTKNGGIKMIFEYSNRLQARGHDILIYMPIVAYKLNNKGFIGLLKRSKTTLGILKRGYRVNWFNLKSSIKLVPKISDKYIRNADASIATAWPTAYDVYNLNNNKGLKYYFVQGYEIWCGKKENVENTYMLNLHHIVVSKWLKDLMMYKFKSKNVDIVYNGINFNEFFNDKKNFNNEHKVVTMVYSKLKLKGFSDGLKAFKMIREKIPDIKLILFGMKKGTDIPDFAEFYLNPRKDELREIYCKSDVFIFPSKGEGWGLTPLEAMACKCAVVATKDGAMNEVGVNGKNALISETDDIEGLASNLYRILTNTDLLEKISINGYNTVLDFSWDKSVEKFENILKNS